LATLDDSREIQRRLRRYIRAADRRLDFLEEKLAGQIVEPNGSLTLEFAIQGIIENADDARVVTDAAGWSANGGSGILVTLDTEDLLTYESELAAVLQEEQDEAWILRICSPEAVLSDAKVQAE
jgi:hypothetical protein